MKLSHRTAFALVIGMLLLSCNKTQSPSDNRSSNDRQASLPGSATSNDRPSNDGSSVASAQPYDANRPSLDTLPMIDHPETTSSVHGSITPSQIQWEKFMMAQERYATTPISWQVRVQGHYGDYIIGYLDGSKSFKVALTGPYPKTYAEAVYDHVLPSLKDGDVVKINGLFYHGVVDYPLVVVNSVSR